MTRAKCTDCGKIFQVPPGGKITHQCEDNIVTKIKKQTRSQKQLPKATCDKCQLVFPVTNGHIQHTCNKTIKAHPNAVERGYRWYQEKDLVMENHIFFAATPVLIMGVLLTFTMGWLLISPNILNALFDWNIPAITDIWHLENGPLIALLLLVAFGAFCIWPITASIGFIRHKRNAYYEMFIFFILLFSVPVIGLISGIYGLWVISHRQTREIFGVLASQQREQRNKKKLQKQR